MVATILVEYEILDGVGDLDRANFMNLRSAQNLSDNELHM